MGRAGGRHKREEAAVATQVGGVGAETTAVGVSVKGGGCWRGMDGLAIPLRMELSR